MGEAAGGDLRRILRTDRQYNATFSKAFDGTLPILERLTGGGAGSERDASDAVVANHTAPQRVVEIERQHLLGPCIGSAPRAAERREVVRQPSRVEVQLG